MRAYLSVLSCVRLHALVLRHVVSLSVIHLVMWFSCFELNTRKVVVFDGGAPALKRKTLLRRQQLRATQKANVGDPNLF